MKTLSKFAIASSLALLAGCQFTPSYKSTANQFLKAIQKGDTRSQIELSCFEPKTDKSAQNPKSIKAWKITKEEIVTPEYDPDTQYKTVYASINSVGAGNLDITQTWKMSVWKTDDLFESHKRLMAKANQMVESTNALVGQVDQLAGTKTEKIAAATVDRKEFSSRPYCVDLIQEANKGF